MGYGTDLQSSVLAALLGQRQREAAQAAQSEQLMWDRSQQATQQAASAQQAGFDRDIRHREMQHQEQMDIEAAKLKRQQAIEDMLLRDKLTKGQATHKEGLGRDTKYWETTDPTMMSATAKSAGMKTSAQEGAKGNVLKRLGQDPGYLDAVENKAMSQAGGQYEGMSNARDMQVQSEGTHEYWIVENMKARHAKLLQDIEDGNLLANAGLTPEEETQLKFQLRTLSAIPNDFQAAMMVSPLIRKVLNNKMVLGGDPTSLQAFEGILAITDKIANRGAGNAPRALPPGTPAPPPTAPVAPQAPVTAPPVAPGNVPGPLDPSEADRLGTLLTE